MIELFTVNVSWFEWKKLLELGIHVNVDFLKLSSYIDFFTFTKLIALFFYVEINFGVNVINDCCAKLSRRSFIIDKYQKCLT